MGRAKQSGTLEERRFLAEERNRLLKEKILSGTNEPLKKYLLEHGIQRTATKLTALGYRFVLSREPISIDGNGKPA